MAAVLRDGDGRSPRRHPAMVRQFDQAGRRHILEFGGDFSTGCAELLQCAVVGVVGLQMADGAGGIRVEHHDPDAHGACGDGEHPAELTAAEDAQDGA